MAPYGGQVFWCVGLHTTISNGNGQKKNVYFNVLEDFFIWNKKIWLVASNPRHTWIAPNGHPNLPYFGIELAANEDKALHQT